MSVREQYRTRGAYFVTMGNYDKAAQEYSELVKKYPADNAGHANLGICYAYLRNLPLAIQEGRQAIAIYPKNVGQRNNVAQNLLYGGKPDEAAKEADAVLKLNPSFERAFVVKALAAVTRGAIPEATATYEELGKVSPRGESYRAAGLADIALYEGRHQDALQFLTPGIAADEKTGWKEGAAAKRIAQASALLALGRKPAALAALDLAVPALKENGLLYWAASVYVQAGSNNPALAIAGDLGYQLESEAQAYSKLIGAEVALARKDPRGAIRLAEEARKLNDTWAGLLILGRAYLALDAFTEADSALEAAYQRGGESFSLTLNALPTCSLYPPLLYHLGLVRQGMNSPSAAEALRAFVTIKERAGSDPLLKDAQARLSR
jgi:tetratricopeptide (TPR) repeat protein